MNWSWEPLGEPKRSAAEPGHDSSSCRWVDCKLREPNSYRRLDHKPPGRDRCHWPDYKPREPNSPMDRSLEDSNRSKDSTGSTGNIHKHRDSHSHSHSPTATQS